VSGNESDCWTQPERGPCGCKRRMQSQWLATCRREAELGGGRHGGHGASDDGVDQNVQRVGNKKQRAARPRGECRCHRWGRRCASHATQTEALERPQSGRGGDSAGCLAGWCHCGRAGRLMAAAPPAGRPLRQSAAAASLLPPVCHMADGGSEPAFFSTFLVGHCHVIVEMLDSNRLLWIPICFWLGGYEKSLM
jgi:hypothetical protein